MADSASSTSGEKKQKSSKQHCCVPLCHSNSSYDPSLSFHHFPSGKNDKERRRQLLIKIRRDEGPLFKITSSTVVCSKHFKNEDFKWTPVLKKLKKEAVPTVFDWSEEKEPRRVVTRKVLSEPVDVIMPESSPEVDQPESTPEENVAVEIDKDERIAILETELKNEKQKCAALQIQLKMERKTCQWHYEAI